MDTIMVNPVVVLPDVPVVVCVLWARVILRVVDENTAVNLFVSIFEIIDHPEAIVEDALVIVVEEVGEGFSVIVPDISVHRFPILVSAGINKFSLVVVDEERVQLAVGAISDANVALAFSRRLPYWVLANNVQRIDIESKRGRGHKQ